MKMQCRSFRAHSMRRVSISRHRRQMPSRWKCPVSSHGSTTARHRHQTRFPRSPVPPSRTYGSKASIPLKTAMAGSGARLLKRSEEHTSELQSLMRISYAVFCLKKKKEYTVHRPNTIQRDKTNQNNYNQINSY